MQYSLFLVEVGTVRRGDCKVLPFRIRTPFQHKVAIFGNLKLTGSLIELFLAFNGRKSQNYRKGLLCTNRYIKLDLTVPENTGKGPPRETRETNLMGRGRALREWRGNKK